MMMYIHVLNRALAGIRSPVDGLESIHGGGVRLICIRYRDKALGRQ